MRALTSSSALVLVLLATTARADVTPQEVWTNWQAMMTSAGQELSVGAVSDTGTTVDVSDLVVTYTDQLGTSASMSFDRLSFADNGDGTVTVTMPDSYPLQMAFPKREDGPGSLKLTVSQPGAVLVAGGSTTETSYKISAPSMTITLDEATDEAGKVLDTEADLTLNEVSGGYVVTKTGETMGLDSDFAAKSAVLNLSGQGDVEAGTVPGDGKVTVSLADLTGATQGNFLSAELMANMAVALNAGFTMESRFGFRAMTIVADVTEPSGRTAFSAEASGGGLDLVMNKDRLRYGTSLDRAKFTLSGPEIPFPLLELAFAESGFNLDMPVSKSESPQDFAFLTKLVDFTVSEDVWGLFDPAGTLARDPATLIVDLKGKGFWKADIMDPSVQMEGAEPPGELHSLDLNQVLAKAAGAEVSASGGFTFDNADVQTFEGMPRPDGKMTININGVAKLIDNLIALGMLTQDDAMGFRMGLAMVAKPGAGPDELVSVIEVKNGELFANGMRMR
ncbi:MAG: DUF2125 domain-containing protein [Tabrizicola sp.]|jgi:hypothetical protein|nr:DUF2125 domain-containing protein [Tabrizicola sp.]